MRRLRCHVLPLIFVAWFTFCYLVGGDGVFFALMASYPTILVETLPFGVVTVCWSSEVPHEDIIGLHRTNKPRPSHGTRACTPPKGLLAHPSQQQLFLIPPVYRIHQAFRFMERANQLAQITCTTHSLMQRGGLPYRVFLVVIRLGARLLLHMKH